MSGITVLHGLDSARRQPAMYIGAEDATHSWHARLFEFVVGAFARDTPAPSEVRVLFGDHGVSTVVSDGEPLPIDASGRFDLHRHFTELLVGTQGLRAVLQRGAVVNALSQMLAVHTMHEGECHQIVFSRGVAAKPLARAPRVPRRGNFWITYRGDVAILGERRLHLEQARDIALRIGGECGVRIVVVDQTNDQSQKS